MSLRILITGAGGFVGTHLIKKLISDPSNDVYGAVYKATSDITTILTSDHIFVGDLTDFEYTEKLIKTVMPDVIYHLAALSVVGGSEKNALNILNSNTSISFNLLEAVHQNSPHARIMAICSANGYGAVSTADLPIKETTPFRPLNPYAVSKVTQEMLALEYFLSYGLDVVILRPFNHTGFGQTTDFIIPALAKQFVAIEHGGTAEIYVGNVNTTRDFTDVSDMVRGYILAAKHCLSGEAYNLGSGHGVTIKEIIELFEKVSGQKVTIKTNPSLMRKSDVPVLIADVAKFANLTNWKAEISLESTISDILEHYRRIEGEK